MNWRTGSEAQEFRAEQDDGSESITHSTCEFAGAPNRNNRVEKRTSGWPSVGAAARVPNCCHSSCCAGDSELSACCSDRGSDTHDDICCGRGHSSTAGTQLRLGNMSAGSLHATNEDTGQAKQLKRTSIAGRARMRACAASIAGMVRSRNAICKQAGTNQSVRSEIFELKPVKTAPCIESSSTKASNKSRVRGISKRAPTKAAKRCQPHRQWFGSTIQKQDARVQIPTASLTASRETLCEPEPAGLIRSIARSTELTSRASSRRQSPFLCICRGNASKRARDEWRDSNEESGCNARQEQGIIRILILSSRKASRKQQASCLVTPL